MKKCLSVLIGAAVLFSIGAAAQTTPPQKSSADISGKWTISMWGAGKEESFPIEIKASGENLTITATHPTLKEMTGTGTLKGDEVSIELKSATLGMTLTGKLSGNKMSGTRKIKSSGSGPGGASGSAPAGGQGGAPGAGGQGGAGAGGNENWTAVKN
jgi:hypothetical protein